MLAALLRLAGSVAAWVSGAGQPTGGWEAGFRVLSHPADPASALGSDGLAAWVYWLVLVLLVGAVVASVLVSWRHIGSIRHRTSHDPRRLAGVATGRDVRAVASQKALLARGRTLRPSLDKPEPSDVGYLLGRSRGQGVWASVEDSILLLGPPRSGKGLHIVINAILDAPGAVITTATRPDNIAATLTARQARGPVAVFDPQHLAEGLPAGLRWSPVRGCEEPAHRDDPSHRSRLSHRSVDRRRGVRRLLGRQDPHRTPGPAPRRRPRQRDPPRAVRLDALTVGGGRRGRDPVEQPEGCAGLGRLAGVDDPLPTPAPATPSGWASPWRSPASPTRASSTPSLPRPGEHFDPVDFLTNNGTLYLLATGAGAGASWSLVAAFIEDLVETARHLAAASPGARLDPPLLLALDEIGNLSPLPSLPVLMAEGGGTGITTMPVLQSLSQARDKWGDHAAGAIWDASIVKVILGGTSSARDLQDLSALIGERDETHRHRLRRRLRLALAPAIHTPRAGHAARGRSAPCPSAPRWCCSAALHRWSQTCARGPPARGPTSSEVTAQRSRPSCADAETHHSSASLVVTWAPQPRQMGALLRADQVGREAFSSLGQALVEPEVAPD